jgi:membrane associated rhomboid family serine protease
MLLIPLKHENMQGRRWPVVTFTLIALNTIAFLATDSIIQKQQPEIAEVRTKILLLAAAHPELDMPIDVQEFVTNFAKGNPEVWKQIGAHYKDLVKATGVPARLLEDPEELQTTMDSLGQRFHETQEKSLLQNYGFVPYNPRPISYLTSIFLHSGWLHLIGNMWFLWLAGFILEEHWGRVIYPIFYLLSGVGASLAHAAMYPHSVIPCLGASGAVAALMGGFLVRFPKLKIDMWGWAFLFRFRFKAPAYWLLPLWLLTEIFYGTLFGQGSGVAHWAHVGGFLFGALAAVVIHRTGLEQQANAVIESKVGWTADTAVVEGSTLLEQGKFDEGIKILKKYLGTKPDAIDANTILAQLYWKKREFEACREAYAKLCQLHLKANDPDAVWQSYQEFKNVGGERLPAATWLEIGRLAETQEKFDLAVREYESLAKAYPNEKQAVLALLSGGRLTLKKLDRPSEALLFYKAAGASPVPHAEWEPNIQKGILEAQKALSGASSPAPSA